MKTEFQPPLKSLTHNFSQNITSFKLHFDLSKINGRAQLQSAQLLRSQQIHLIGQEKCTWTSSVHLEFSSLKKQVQIHTHYLQ